MAAIVAADVSLVTAWIEPLPGFTRLHRILNIALSGNGGTANDIPASLLGFKEIWTAQTILYIVTAGTAAHLVPVIVEADKEGILTINLADATDATRSAPANVVAAGTLRVYITGLATN